MSLTESLIDADTLLDPDGLESGENRRSNAPMPATSPDRGLSIEVGERRNWAADGDPNFGTVAARVLDMAGRFPDRPAIRGPISDVTGTYEELSYYDLVQNAGKLATSIREACLSWGHPMTDSFVAILLPRDIQYVVAMLATFLCGAAYLPMSDKLPEERLKYMLEDGKPSLIITSKVDALKGTLKGMLRPRPPCPVLYIEDVQLTLRTLTPPKDRVRATPAADYATMGVYSTLPNTSSLAYMIYTSGTTGKPKGVEVEHHSFLNVLLSHVESGNVDKDADLRKSACVAAFIFDSHVREVWMPLAWGGCLCIAENVLHLTEGTMSAGTPSGLLASGSAGSLPAELKTVMAGGERLTEQVVRAITHPNTEITKVINAYGPTETVIESLIWKADLRNIPEAGVPVGLPISNGIAYGIKITDGERNEVVVEELKNTRNPQHLLAHRGEPCELYMGGESCARGYHNRPDLTRERFLRDPFVTGVGHMYQTGDLVIFGQNPGDPVTYIGRADTQVKINGKRLELGEVESKLGLLEGVQDVRVLLKKQSGGKQHLVAYVVWAKDVRKATDANLSADLVKFARDTMEDYKRPSFVVNFPITIGDAEHVSFGTIKTAGGKTDLRALPDPLEWSGQAPPAAKAPIPEDRLGKSDSQGEGAFGKAAAAAPVAAEAENKGDGSAENMAIDAEVILRVIQDLLDQQNLPSDHLTTDDDFFSSGLSSIDVPRLKFELKTELGVDVSTEAILGNSSALKLAEFLSKPEEDSGVNISKEDLLAEEDILDAPLAPWLVWLLSFAVAFVAHAVTIALWGFVFFVPLLSAHEFGKCWDTTWETYGFYNQCERPDKWRAFWVVAATFPVLWPVSICVTMLMSVVAKWIVIGKTKPGVYSLDSWYYFRWLFVHYLEVFVRSWLMTQLPFRASGLLKVYLRLMGAQIGDNVVLDTLDIHEMDCLVIDDGVCIQSEAMLSGHTFATVGGSKKNKKIVGGGRAVLVIGTTWIKKGSVVGPLAVITPQLPSPGTLCSPAKDATVIEGVFPALQASSRLGQSLRLAEPMMKVRNGGRPTRETTVWTPPVPVPMQIFGTLVMIFFEWAAVMPALAFTYAFLVPEEPGLLIWWARLALWSSPWVMGIPYAMCMIFFKWTAIGTFRAEQSTPYLDCMRWLLMNLLGNRNQVAFEMAGASTEILHGFYRMMGMKIGWNAQVMPVRVVEFDLFEVGDCVAFGGLVSVFCRDANGMQAACSIGEYSAITNSAAMLAGSKIGRNCLVGNLTLLPPHYKVPSDSKCVGTKYLHGALQDPVVFKNKSVVKSDVWRANWTMTGHIIASLMFDIPEQPGLVLVSWFLVLLQNLDDEEAGVLHLAHLPGGIGFVYFTFNWVLFLVVLCATASIIIVKRSTLKFLGTHVRDSPIMVVFIYLTKLMMNQQGWTQVANGTPLQSLIYRLMGSDISLSARVFMRQFTDVDGLQVCGTHISGRGLSDEGEGGGD
jgi:non-ribosomal peptide synthetase component F/carbonic anhydrase/acetyltransferase-like protein (isoleucine patch superfamily)